MKIARLRIANYRTLEKLDLELPSNFTAVCGANDSGKTNVVRAVRALMKEEEPIFYPADDEKISFKVDFPKWLSSDQHTEGITVGMDLEIDVNRDAGLYQFVTRQLTLENPPSQIDLSIDVRYVIDKADPDVIVTTAGREYSGLEAQEVLKRIQTSRSILFHNSTEPDPRVHFRGGFGELRDVSTEHHVVLDRLKKTVNKGMAKIAKGQQQEFEQLLGRLQKKYRVGLSLPTFDFSFVPINITLGERKFDVPLDNWGSGTRNRTLILLTLFRAKQISEAVASASKITPLIVIEEPESFLHPSAQAEFGRVLQDLAVEFDVQVIVTTHSPYMLSVSNPASNILLCRKEHYNQARETQQLKTSAENWMAPFAQALGMVDDELKPWSDLVLSQSDAILMVEGELDREYFELLRHHDHGTNRLLIEGEILPYEGTGALSNTVLLRFVKNRHKKLFVTYDLDAEGHVAKSLAALGLEKTKHYWAVGLNQAGKRNIEGLLPDSVRSTVYTSHPDLAQAAMSGTTEEKKAAWKQLKRLLLEEFKAKAVPGHEYYGLFYPIVKAANRAFANAG